MDQQATTPTLEPREPEAHYHTPNKTAVRGAVEFCDRMGLPYFKKDVFRTFEVSHTQGWEMLRKETSPRRRNNDPDKSETRGRKKIISPKEIREMERILEDECFEDKALHESNWTLRPECRPVVEQFNV